MESSRAGNYEEMEAESIIGLIKLRRVSKSGNYVSQGYKYKTDKQLEILIAVFEITPYPTSQTREALGILLNINPRSIQIWFQNSRRRAEWLSGPGTLERHKMGVSSVRLLRLYTHHYGRRQ